MLDTITVEVDVNLILLGFDKLDSDFSSVQNGILEELNVRKIQRFLEIHGSTIRERDESHVEYKVHYHFINLHPMVQIYLSRFMNSTVRNIDINLMNMNVINPYDLVKEFQDLFSYVQHNSNKAVPNKDDLIIVIMNSQLNLGGRHGFSTEFSYSELQRMIDEIFKENSEFAIGEFIFPLTEPVTLNDHYDEYLEDESVDNPGLHGVEVHPISGVPDFSTISTENYCILDWRELSFLWAHSKYIQLMERFPRGFHRTSQDRIRHNLELLRDYYDKKEQMRILLMMKQLLNNEYLMNDDLINLVEGTHTVSDYIFLKQFLLVDISAGPFEWGSIQDDSNMRTKSSLVWSSVYNDILRYYENVNEAFLDHVQLVSHLLLSSPIRKEYNSDLSELQRIRRIIQKDSVTTTELHRCLLSLIEFERKYPSKDPLVQFNERNGREMEVIIRLSREIGDFIAHFVTPPFIVSTDSMDTTSSMSSPDSVDSLGSRGSTSLATTLPDSSSSHENFHSTLHRFRCDDSYHHYVLSIDPNVSNRIHSKEELSRALNEGVFQSFSPKNKVHFQINYFTRAEFEDVFTIDENYFDFSIFRSEIEKLKLPSQEFYFSFQEFKLEREPRLQTAVLRAMSTAIIPHLSTKKAVFPVQQKYLNSTVLFEALRSHSNSIASHDVQIYIFCMTDPMKRPMFLDRSKQVVSHSDGFNNFVFAVQNERISTNAPYFVNGIPMYYNLHNIMPSLLEVVFELISNTRLTVYFGERIHTNEAAMIEDCIHRPIGSVDPIFSSNTVYSQFHVEIIKRSEQIVHLQMMIEEFDGLMERMNDVRDKMTAIQREMVIELHQSFMECIDGIEGEEDLQKREGIMKKAMLLVGKIRWMWELIQQYQAENCKTKVASINYMHVLSRSFIAGTILAVIYSISMQKSRKKLKEL